MGTVSRGDHFGEQALLSAGTRAHAVRAVDDVVLQRISQDAFQRVLAGRPELKTCFEQHLADLATRNFLRLSGSLRTLKPAEVQAILRHLERRSYPAAGAKVDHFTPRPRRHRRDRGGAPPDHRPRSASRARRRLSRLSNL